MHERQLNSKQIDRWCITFIQ